jgi:peptidoglycan hydrolase-like protein with peptidoglycan-binding domain
VHRPPARTARRTASSFVVFLAAAAALLGVVVGPTSANAAVRVAAPRTPVHLPSAIESQWTPYVPQDSCSPAFKRGTKKLIALLHRTYPDVYSGGDYACGTDGSVSEHYEGRAIDWMASVDNKRQHAEALKLIKWMLATDSDGNKFANARRLGVMYLIYDNRIWGTWDGRWDPYNGCAKTPQAAYDNSCHRTHLHISLTWNGAIGRTSFWTGKVKPTDYGPCRAKGLNWASKYTGYNPTPCPDYPGARVPKGASATVKALAQYSGAYLHKGSHGPAVSAVQSVLHVSASGTYASATKSAVRSFQRKHKLPVTGAMNTRTWQGLLASVTPKPHTLSRR